ncbi:MAG TPA: hypothetical protein PK413_11770 [Thermoanaerobaculia bacterium]|nr:hypothetical protein [Thermoanaerobaculia bacterium]
MLLADSLTPPALGVRSLANIAAILPLLLILLGLLLALANPGAT